MIIDIKYIGIWNVIKLVNKWRKKQKDVINKSLITVKPWFNKPLYNKVLDITNDILRSKQN